MERDSRGRLFQFAIAARMFGGDTATVWDSRRDHGEEGFLKESMMRLKPFQGPDRIPGQSATDIAIASDERFTA
jgi:hypothetical protein